MILELALFTYYMYISMTIFTMNNSNNNKNSL